MNRMRELGIWHPASDRASSSRFIMWRDIVS